MDQQLTEQYQTELTDYRQMKDEFFANDPGSPLSKQQKSLFKGLRYFPPNKTLHFELKLEPFDEYVEVELQTSTGDVQSFHRHGKIHFTVDGQPAQLTVYANEHGLFLPFADSLAGTETYPAGRYLEPHALDDGRLLVDFNLAYNPYCAYSPHWSCPLTPFENRLKLPIRAGEMLPDPAWSAQE